MKTHFETLAEAAIKATEAATKAAEAAAKAAETAANLAVVLAVIAADEPQTDEAGRPASTPSLYVEGRLQYRSYQDEEGKERGVAEIVASDVQFLARRRTGPDGTSSTASSPSTASPSPTTEPAAAPAHELPV